MSASPLENTFGVRMSESLSTATDFAKQRRRLNRTLVRLRHDLGMVERDTTNYHKKKTAAGIPSEDKFAEEKYWNYYLLLAERYLLHALETKASIEFGADHRATLKKLMGRKLVKAAATNRILLAGVKNQLFSLRLVEVYVYAALTEGFLAVFKKRWASALHAYSLARCGLVFLQASADVSVNKLMVEELIADLVDSSLDLVVSQERIKGAHDLLSVAKIHSSDNRLPHLQRLVELISSQDASFFDPPKTEELSKSVTWRSHSAQVDNDQIAFLIAKVEKDTWGEHQDKWDDIPSQWQTLVELHQAGLAKNKYEDEPERAQNDAIILTYLKYNMYFAQINRDCHLISWKANHLSSTPAERVKHSLLWYDSILTTIELIRDLPGVYNDEDLAESLENLSHFFRAKRSVVVAQCYARNDHVAEALSIYSHLDRVFSVNDDFYKVSFPYNVASLEDAYELSQLISAFLTKTHAMAQLLKDRSRNSYVVDDIHNFAIAGNPLTKILNVAERANVAPVASKAVLFDIAFNYISYNLETTKVMEAAERETELDKKKSGFFGIFGR